jgi:glucose/arabinose dehydrogenase
MIPVVSLAVALAALQAPVRPAAGKPARPAAAAAAPAAAPTPARPPAPAGLSWADADDLQRTIDRMERRIRSGRTPADETVVVTERQLNSYVTLSLGSQLPPGVSGLQLRLQRDRLAASALVDLDRVKTKLPAGTMSGMLAFLGGTVPVQLDGRVSTANGQGRVAVEQASVGGISLPSSVVAQIVSMATRNAARPQGFDILAPFPLPWSARQVRLEPGRALLDFFPQKR